MRSSLPLALAALAGLAACHDAGPGPIVGGPCSYETTMVDATVTDVENDGATFNGPEGEFWVPLDYLHTLPAVGETLTLKHERITEGTCTPDIYSVVKRDD
ncbi:MAG TPA: hypothetical protein PLR76_03175 [Hyphomonas sp.]|nr:hypothetical protein [Hyphomonas sp.]MCB9962396.1 hypothetical protein [Hyphomonas sp.]HPE47365.1 hypothetical protein [Hyphomonas sp.]